jgi:hypothetical protein
MLLILTNIQPVEREREQDGISAPLGPFSFRCVDLSGPRNSLRSQPAISWDFIGSRIRPRADQRDRKPGIGMFEYQSQTCRGVVRASVVIVSHRAHGGP